MGQQVTIETVMWPSCPVIGSLFLWRGVGANVPRVGGLLAWPMRTESNSRDKVKC